MRVWVGGVCVGVCLSMFITVCGLVMYNEIVLTIPYYVKQVYITCITV